MSAQLPPKVKAWVDAKGEWGPKWEIVFLRTGSMRHVEKFHTYAVDRLFNRVRPWTVLRRIAVLARFSRQLGERPFDEITTKDIEAVVNAPGYTKYRSLSLEPTQRLIPNNGSLQSEQLVTLRLFLRHLHMQAGMKEDDADEAAASLVLSAKLADVGPNRRLPQLRLTAADIASLYRAAVGLLPTRRGALYLTLWLNLLVAHGPRAAGCLRSRVGNLTSTGGQWCIAVPPGYLIKKTIPLFLDEVTGKLMVAYMAEHPGRSDRNAPLFLDLEDLERGRVKALEPDILGNLLARLGRRAGLPKRLGIRSFRKYMATRAAVEGASQPRLRRRLGHTNRSFVTNRYIQLSRGEVVEVFRGLRHGIIGRFSPCCGFQYRPADTVCGHCGASIGTNADLHAMDPARARRDAAGELGLDCISDLEAPHAPAQ